MVAVCAWWAEPSTAFRSLISGQNLRWRKERRETSQKEPCGKMFCIVCFFDQISLMDNLYRSNGHLVLYCSFLSVVVFALYISLCSWVWWRIQCPCRTVRVCDLNFQVSTVSWDCVFIYYVYVFIYLLTCHLFSDSWGHVMHYLFDFSPLFPPWEPILFFLTFGVERKTVSLILYHITFFCILFGCRSIVTYFKSIG